MRMAKLQKATLDPSKISGRCGRLKCCLRYEYDTYQELQRDLPPIGAQIITSKGRAEVLAQEILAGQVLVRMDDMRRVVIDASEVITVLGRGGSRGKSDRQPLPEPEGGGVAQAELPLEGDSGEGEWTGDSPLESREE
jgi:cell fate regulator YaaT (PSP1 superfamily)